jgi:hypothetical protein
MYRLILQHAIGVDDEKSAQGNALRVEVNVIGTGDGPVTVARQGELDLPQAPSRPRRSNPLLMGLKGVCADRQDVASSTAEFLHAGAEGRQLSGTHQREITRVKDQDQPAVAVVGEPDLLGQTGSTCARQLKLRGTLTDICLLNLHHQCLVYSRRPGTSF